MPQMSVVMTTINSATTIRDYAMEIGSSEHNGEILVVGDRKGDAELTKFCAALRSDGLPVRHVGVAEQIELMARFTRLRPHLRWNSIQRRNIGYLLAAESSADVVVSVDDDNVPVGGSYLAHHAVVGRSGRWRAVRSPSGWFNVAELLENEPPVVVRHRGFPLDRGMAAAGSTEWTEVDGRVVVNAGLWTGDPDIDAVTRIAIGPETLAVRSPHDQHPFVLHPSTWCPFNSQNTAFHGEVLPACFLWNMREPVGRGEVIDRYDDIFMSYFARRVIDAMGDLVAYGPPVVSQARNEHDLLVDLVGETPGMRITGRLIDLLAAVEVRGSTYAECSASLMDELQDAVVRLPDADRDLQVYLLRSLAALDGWLGSYAQIRT